MFYVKVLTIINKFINVPLQASIKFKSNEIMQKTPVIILSNNEQLFDMEEKYWKDRMYRLICKPYPLIAKINKPLHPLGWRMIFEQYGYV